MLDVHQNNPRKQLMNTECECNYCKCGDQPFDEELTLEMRIDIAEAALMGIRQHLWQLDHKLDDLYKWAKSNYDYPKK
jgi:hypothetical protein